MTPEQVHKLSDEELRIEVARRLPSLEDGAWRIVPDYPQDLNACHDMEASLGGIAYYHYYTVLEQLCLDNEVSLASAPARLRAEAFVIAKGNK